MRVCAFETARSQFYMDLDVVQQMVRLVIVRKLCAPRSAPERSRARRVRVRLCVRVCECACALWRRGWFWRRPTLCVPCFGARANGQAR